MQSNFITKILYKNIYWRYDETIHTYTEPLLLHLFFYYR